MTFEIGSPVRTRARGNGHTRLPGYLERRQGVIVAHLGAFVFPDDYVRDPAHPRTSDLFTVAFDAKPIFGDGGAETIYADLFAEYLEARP
jgi:Nitrile hydratase beta subunit, C-terminal